MENQVSVLQLTWTAMIQSSFIKFYPRPLKKIDSTTLFENYKFLKSRTQII